MASELRVDRIVPTTGVPTGGGGGIIQVKQTVRTDTYSITCNAHTTASSDAIQVQITPTRSDSKVLILVSLHGSSAYMGNVCCGSWQGFLMKNGSILVQGDASSNRQRMTMRTGDSDSNQVEEPLNFNYLDSPATTSAVTYGVRFHNSDNGSKVMYLNRSSNDSDSVTTTTRTVSTITAMEVSG